MKQNGRIIDPGSSSIELESTQVCLIVLKRSIQKFFIVVFQNCDGEKSCKIQNLKFQNHASGDNRCLFEKKHSGAASDPKLSENLKSSVCWLRCVCAQRFRQEREITNKTQFISFSYSQIDGGASERIFYVITC